MSAHRRLRTETLEAVSGIVTLAHESWHLRGIVDEARTQVAVQTTEAVASVSASRPATRGQSLFASPPKTRAPRRASTTPHSAGPVARTTCARAQLPGPAVEDQPRCTNTHGRTSPGRGELR